MRKIPVAPRYSSSHWYYPTLSRSLVTSLLTGFLPVSLSLILLLGYASPVFSPPYKCMKTCKNNSTFHKNFTDFFTDLSFFVKNSQECRFLWRNLLADEWYTFFFGYGLLNCTCTSVDYFLSKARNTISEKYTHYGDILKHVEITKF